MKKRVFEYFGIILIFLFLATMTGGCFVTKGMYDRGMAEAESRVRAVKARNQELEEKLRALQLKYEERGRVLKDITDKYIARSDLDKKLKTIEKGLRDVLRDTEELEAYIESTVQTNTGPLDEATINEWLVRTREIQDRIEALLRETE